MVLYLPGGAGVSEPTEGVIRSHGHATAAQFPIEHSSGIISLTGSVDGRIPAPPGM